MSDIIELKPCPFCGGTATLFVSDGVRVICLKCRAQSKTSIDSLDFSRPTHAIANVVKSWNKRVGDKSNDE